MNDGREENDKPAKAARGPFAGARVLVVEDDLSISDVVSSALAQDGYVCTCAYSGTEARMLFESGSSFDIVLCDLMLPGLSGEELIARIRERCGVPILVASAKGEASDRVALLRMGADDYVVKPFDLDELLARIEALLRRSAAFRQSTSTDRSMSFRKWVVDEESREFTAAGAPVRLTRTEFDIVCALVRHPKKVYTKRELFEIARNEEALSDEKTINTHVSNIRAKLKGTGTEGYIETVWGIGFKLSEDD
ncbi:response regulator transcription factor [Slackia piriformis]|uniref:response regulator transcription factor n=1 Tax=Slackia piriformis TaxID=626934 RepID=UPI002490A265|nr:response regulator transcription factor [Slackia piriformis]